MKIRIAGVVNDSIVDGPGLRYAVFAQGCDHACPGCHNPNTHDRAGGKEAETDDLISEMKGNVLLSGLTLSGGEPFLQPEACEVLALGAKAAGLNVWVYTGYTFEALLAQGDRAALSLLRATDVLVDGPFVLEKRSLEVPWRGSGNQRLIDVAASLECGQAVLWSAQ